MNARITTLPALLLACGLASQAIAQNAQERKLEGSFDQPLSGKQHEGRAPAPTSRMVIMETDGEHKYELTIEGDQLAAKVDGVEVPAERLRRTGSRVEILDQGGAVVKTFNLPRTARGMRLGNVPLLPDIPIENFRFEPDAQQAVPYEPPPVMMGINMSDADPAVLEHLGIESGIRVDRVLEGLPSAKAGLRVGDVITAIDGKKPVDQDALRKTLREKKPGDTITLQIVRKGGEETVKVELAAFDRQRLGMPAQPHGGDEAPNPWRGFDPEGRGGVLWSLPDALNSPEVRRKIEDAREELRKSIERLKAELKEQNVEGKVREEVERLVEQLGKIRDEMREQARGLRQGPEALRFRQGVAAPTVPAVPEVPPTPATPRAPGDNELAELRKQNRELREQLDKMNGRFDELMKRLDEMSKRGG